jgi:hypothetical protein
LRQRPEYGSKIPGSVARQKAADVFDKNPAGGLLCDDAGEFPPQAASLSSQSSTLPSHGNILAGESSAEDVDSESSPTNRGNVCDGFLIRKVPPSHAVAFRILLGSPHGLDTASMESEVGAAQTGE